MKTLCISYSLTGNNEALAASIASRLGADHVKVTDAKKRTMRTTAFDMLFNRTPKISMPEVRIADYGKVIFLAPIWMSKIASPLRGCFKKYSSGIGSYAFVSLSGGAIGMDITSKLKKELEKLLGKKPEQAIDLHIADLLPKDIKPGREANMTWHMNDKDLKSLTDSVLAKLS